MTKIKVYARVRPTTRVQSQMPAMHRCSKHVTPAHTAMPCVLLCRPLPAIGLLDTAA